MTTKVRGEVPEVGAVDADPEDRGVEELMAEVDHSSTPSYVEYILSYSPTNYFLCWLISDLSSVDVIYRPW